MVCLCICLSFCSVHTCCACVSFMLWKSFLLSLLNSPLKMNCVLSPTPVSSVSWQAKVNWVTGISIIKNPRKYQWASSLCLPAWLPPITFSWVLITRGQAYLPQSDRNHGWRHTRRENKWKAMAPAHPRPSILLWQARSEANTQNPQNFQNFCRRQSVASGMHGRGHWAVHKHKCVHTCPKKSKQEKKQKKTFDASAVIAIRLIMSRSPGRPNS